MAQLLTLGHTYTTVEDCEDNWGNSGAGVTQGAGADFMVGTRSVQIVEDGTSGTGELATETITSTDLSAKTHVSLWIKSTIALAASDLNIKLFSSGATLRETLNIPATAISKWTNHVIALANPASDGAIITVTINQAVDVGACTIYLDDIQAFIGDQFYPLQAKGIDRPDNCENWPPQQDDLLDGTLYENILGFRRKPVIDILVKHDIVEEVFVHTWQRASDKRIYYNGDSVIVVLEDAAGVMGAYEQSELTTIWSMSLREKTLRTTTPPSWV